MTRAEHMQWCKARAREYIACNDLTGAVTSMVSDLGKHEETKGARTGMFAVKSPSEARHFIEGFAE